ncbi:MAG: site-2 protease family protein [Microbacteriaceae bacterium]|nr:site-2 protease family protein [Microbacteriaceae bacterium]
METALLYILGVVILALGLLISIALHEIGHLIPAKLFGVRVGQYMIGFGKTLWSTTKGDTEYGIKAIPLGGYISMAGMLPPKKPGDKPRSGGTGFMETMIQDARLSDAEKVLPGQEHRTFYNLPIWKRIIIMLGGPFMNLVIAVVLYAIVICGFGIPQLSTTVGSVSECLIPATSSQQKCSSTDPKAPAALAGVRPGDQLVSIGGRSVTTWAEATKIIQDSAGKQLTLEVKRGGELLSLQVTPALTERYQLDADGKIKVDSKGDSLTHEVGMLGISSAYELVPQTLGAVPPAVWSNIAGVTNIILNLPQRLVQVAQAAFGPKERDPNGPMSVVGVGRIAGEITSINTIPVVEKIQSLLGVLASLNIALLVFNLIPLMPLDGGHVAGALWEGIRRFFAKLFSRKDPGPVDVARLLPLTMAVVVILGAMSLLLIYADIVKPVSLF